MNLTGGAGGTADYGGHSFRVRFADTEALKEAAYIIRHKAYVDVGAIEPREDQQFNDEFDTLKNNRTYVLFMDEKPVGAIRASIFHPAHGFDSTPGFRVYRADIEGRLGLASP